VSFTKIWHAKYIIPCSTILLENPIASQLLNIFPALYTYLSFIITFTRARHLSLAWVTSIQHTPHYTSWRYISILSSHTRSGVKSGLFPSDFPTETPYALLYPIRTTRPAHLILLNLIVRLNMWCWVQIMKLLIMQSFPFPCYFSLLNPNIFSTIPLSNTFSLCCAVCVRHQILHQYKQRIILMVCVF